MEKKTLIIGPSHIMRWKHAIESNILPKLENVELYGRGGNPIWSNYSEQAEDRFDEFDEIIYIVGDFRFGNKSLSDPTLTKNQFGVSKELISHKNDLILYKKVIKKCNNLITKHNQKIKFLFWDLALREHQNKKNNRYITNGVYKHPIWNLNEVERKFPKNTIPLSKLDVSNFYIDRSNHPSIQGYQYLYNSLVFNEKKTTSATPFEINFDDDVIFCGDSIFVKTFNQYVNLGIIKSNQIEEVFLSQIDSFSKKNKNKKIIFLSNIRSINDNDELFINRIDKLYQAKNKNKNLDVILWDAYAQEIISSREKAYSKFNPKHVVFKANNLITILSNQSDYFPDISTTEAQSLVELNVGLQPTLSGLLWALLYSTGSIETYRYESKKIRKNFPHIDNMYLSI